MKLETQKERQLKKLMDEWRKQISDKPAVCNGGRWATSDAFISDGFFPGYFSDTNEGKRILFVAREGRYLNEDYVQEMLSDFKNGKWNNNTTFFRRIAKIAYGVQNNGISFKKVPTLLEIFKQMDDNINFNFAIMNISKYPNYHSKKWQTNKKAANRFLKDSELDKRNFFLEEIELLEPDVIITGNLWESCFYNEYLDLCFPENKKIQSDRRVQYSNPIDHWYMTIGNKKVNVINTYHFSAVKKDQEDFYDPVMKILFPKK